MITENEIRNGAFTSSNAYLMVAKARSGNGFSAAALTYIRQRKIERRMGRTIDLNKGGRSALWGLALEGYVYNFLGDFGYDLVSHKSVAHPKHSFWAGSPDLLLPKIKVGDIKSYEPENFSVLTDAILEKDIEVFKESCPKEYWQLVSNAAINKTPRAEIISFMPYKKDLEAVKDYIDNIDDGMEQWRYKFISDAIGMDDLTSLPYLPDNGYYKDLNRFEFEVPEGDIDFLKSRILLAEASISDQPIEKETISTEPDFSLLKKI